ncbi:MAG: hypothetical protein V1661_00145 [bacterium]
MKKIIPFVLVVLVVAGAMFYAGINYAKAKGAKGFGNFQNLTSAQRQQMGAGNSGTAGGNFGRGLIGEVLSKGDGSFTIKLKDGSTNIIFVGADTKISKSVEAVADDVKVGAEIMVSGDKNSDGSYAAKTINLTPPALPIANTPPAQK